MSAKPLIIMNQDLKNIKLNNNVTAELSQGLRGEIYAPGDKSISHRCVILSSVALGESRINGLLESTDVVCTIEAMRSLGCDISLKENTCIINGIGIGSLMEPIAPLDFGNSGTAARLIMGLVSTHPIKSIFTGDESLSKRPMKRVVDPLIEFGAGFTLNKSEFFPIIVTRDHTERLLEIYGYDVAIKENKENTKISIVGQQILEAVNINIPGDPSSAGYPIVAGLICKDSNLTVKNILVNPTRDGLYKSLIEMGAKIDLLNKRSEAGEEVFDISVRSSNLRGIEVPASRAPSMIDDFPILAVAASVADGISIFRGLSELKVKESDRLLGIKHFLEVNGVDVSISNDDLIIKGSPGGISGGGSVNTNLDHRMAMSSLVLGLVSNSPVLIDDSDTINTSFPGFINLMVKLGAKLKILDLSKQR